ncbi:acid phosphatase [Diutina catenulata]
MQLQFLQLCLLAAVVVAKNILLTNDDGWSATNIRATYHKLKEAGHNVLLVASVVQKSGNGGRFEVPSSETLEEDGEFGYPKRGAPSWDHEPDDDHVWYFNGTPASCVAFALSHLVPEKFDNMTIDLTVSGPNEGPNMGPNAFSGSGTVGAALYSVYRGIPAVAFSGSNFNNSFYKDDLDLDNDKAPPTIYANKIVEFVDHLFAVQNETGQPVLRPGYGVNVNFPLVGKPSKSDAILGLLTGKDIENAPECYDPVWADARVSGNSSSLATVKIVDGKAQMSFGLSAFDGCIHGDCSYPGETFLYASANCTTTVSLFSFDTDADTASQHRFAEIMAPLVDEEKEGKKEKGDEKDKEDKEDKEDKKDKKNKD